MKCKSLTVERIREVLNYDQSTGAFTWKVRKAQRTKVGDVAGSDNGRGYIIIEIDGHAYRAHRLAWLYVHGKWPDGDIDHKNLRRSDNRIDNLRDVPHVVNTQNQPAMRRNNTSGYRGACLKSSGSFSASISVNGRQVYIGTYQTALDASAAFEAAKRKYHQGAFQGVQNG